MNRAHGALLRTVWGAAASGRAAARHQQHAQADLQALQRHIEASRRGPARVDLILTDYRLGDNLDGEDAVQRIRRYLARPVPALIITGDTSPERIREADASGNRLLHKPLDTEQLREAIAASQS